MLPPLQHRMQKEVHMNNLSKIKKFSRGFYLLLTVFLIVLPLYYAGYWIFINDFPETLITVNTPSESLVPHHLPAGLRLAGFAACLLPLAAVWYGLFHIRKLFSYYRSGTIFSFQHVRLFKKIARALMAWVLLSILYESAKSVLFSLGNPPGQRVLSVGFTSSELTMLLIGGLVFFIAWIMDEGRRLHEENQLTV